MEHLVDVSFHQGLKEQVFKLFLRGVDGWIFCFANFLKKVFTLFFYFKNFDIENNDVNSFSTASTALELFFNCFI